MPDEVSVVLGFEDVFDDAGGGRVRDVVVPDVAQAAGVLRAVAARGVGLEGVRGAVGGIVAGEDIGPDVPGDVGEAAHGGEQAVGLGGFDGLFEELAARADDVEGDDGGGGAAVDDVEESSCLLLIVVSACFGGVFLARGHG